jgi:hypothetical protein
LSLLLGELRQRALDVYVYHLAPVPFTGDAVREGLARFGGGGSGGSDAFFIEG